MFTKLTETHSKSFVPRKPVLGVCLGFLSTSLLAATHAAADEQTPLTLDTMLVPSLLIQGEPLAAREDEWTLRQRMLDQDVPGLSVAVFIDGKIAWAKGYGVADRTSQRAVTSETLFQAASISKPVAAYGALAMVQDGLLSLDKPINTFLRSWQIPKNEFTHQANTAAAPVTLRQLLSHTAGTSVSGFPGYAQGEPVPTAVELLDGQGNTDPVRVTFIPGSDHSYSGGGYTIAQLAMVDSWGEEARFPQIMDELVLDPLGMTNSTFQQPLPSTLRDKAASGHRDSRPLGGGSHTYPEMAAAGLWTTPSDLAKFFMSIQKGMTGEDGPVLSAQSVQEMLTIPGEVQYGLGLNVGSERIGHGGGNAGFRCVATAFNEGGDGIVVMTNSDSGWNLGSEVLRTLFIQYGWPGLRPIEKQVVSLSLEQLQRCVGAYTIDGFGVVEIEVDPLGDRLLVKLPDQTSYTLRSSSESIFFDPDDGVEVIFNIRDGAPASSFEWSGVVAKRAD